MKNLYKIVFLVFIISFSNCNTSDPDPISKKKKEKETESLSIKEPEINKEILKKTKTKISKQETQTSDKNKSQKTKKIKPKINQTTSDDSEKNKPKNSEPKIESDDKNIVKTNKDETIIKDESTKEDKKENDLEYRSSKPLSFYIEIDNKKKVKIEKKLSDKNKFYELTSNKNDKYSDKYKKDFFDKTINIIYRFLGNESDTKYLKAKKSFENFKKDIEESASNKYTEKKYKEDLKKIKSKKTYRLQSKFKKNYVSTEEKKLARDKAYTIVKNENNKEKFLNIKNKILEFRKYISEFKDDNISDNKFQELINEIAKLQYEIEKILHTCQEHYGDIKQENEFIGKTIEDFIGENYLYSRSKLKSLVLEFDSRFTNLLNHIKKNPFK